MDAGEAREKETRGHPRDVGTPTEARRIRGARGRGRGDVAGGGGGGGGEGEESRRCSRGISRIAPARDAHGASVDALPDAGVARPAECEVGARERDRNPPRRIIRGADFFCVDGVPVASTEGCSDT